MLIFDLLIYALSFLGLWVGAGLIVTAASKFSQKLRIAPFAFSFVFLGILTSTPEFSIGIQAAMNNQAEIFVGNLLGGIVVLFLLIIPLLAFFGNGVSLKHEFSVSQLVAAMLVIYLPSLLTIDKRVTNFEGVIMICSYLIFLYFVQRKNGIFDKNNERLLNAKAYSYKDILKILLGIGIVFVTSNLIVEKTLYFADVFSISAFYISLIVVALGTDLPELSLAIRSVLSGEKALAMGDYLGAASVSTFLFGIFTLLHHGEVVTVSNFLVTTTFIAAALALFFAFSVIEHAISRKDSLIFLSLYVLFAIFEFIK